MTERYSVTVLIPCRDYGRYLDEALDSIAAQTLQPDEVLVIDDGSTDETSEVLDRVTTRLPRLNLRVIRHEAPQGFTQSMIEGLEAASCGLVAHVDADDRVLPTYLERLVRAMESHPDAAYAYPRIRLFGAEDGIYLSGPFEPARLLYDGNYIPHIGVLRRSAYFATRGYRDLPTHVDWDLWLSMVEAGQTAVFVDEVLYEWRRHPGTMTLQAPAALLLTRLRVQFGHPRLLLRYLLPGLPHLVRSIWRRIRVRIPFGSPPYARTPSCWIEAVS